MATTKTDPKLSIPGHSGKKSRTYDGLTREQLIDIARGSTHVAFDRSIDVQVSRLRYKLEQDAKNPSLIRTVRNAGYMFLPEVTRG